MAWPPPSGGEIARICSRDRTASDVPIYYSPMHKDAATSVEAILDEFVACWEVLQQVLVINVVDFDDMMSEAFELFLVQRKPQNRDNMSDTTLL
jgi:hypothetical protein